MSSARASSSAGVSSPDNTATDCGLVVVRGNGDRRVYFAELPDQIFHQRPVFRRGFHPTAMAGRHDAQQVEESYGRDISGHDDLYFARRFHRNRIGLEPCLQTSPVEHIFDNGSDRPTDIRGGEPTVFAAGPFDRPLRRLIVSEGAQPSAQFAEKFYCVFHRDKSTNKRG